MTRRAHSQLLQALVFGVLCCLACAQEDPQLAACKRAGWVFLPNVQQQSWRAIMNCDVIWKPWNACDADPSCIGFISTGNNGNSSYGWMYRLPMAKACPKSGLDSLQNLAWEWTWQWAPLKCKDPGPCCGTYICHDAGENAAWTLSCGQPSAGARPSQHGLACPAQDRCPALHITHAFSSYSQFESECKQQLQSAGAGSTAPSNGRRRLKTSHLGALPWHASGRDGATRGLSASSPASGMQRGYEVAITKQASGVAKTAQVGFIKAHGSRECLAVAKACGTLNLS